MLTLRWRVNARNGPVYGNVSAHTQRRVLLYRQLTVVARAPVVRGSTHYRQVHSACTCRPVTVQLAEPRCGLIGPVGLNDNKNTYSFMFIRGEGLLSVWTPSCPVPSRPVLLGLCTVNLRQRGRKLSWGHRHAAFTDSLYTITSPDHPSQWSRMRSRICADSFVV